MSLFIFRNQCAACEGSGEQSDYYSRFACQACDGIGQILSEDGEQIRQLIVAMQLADERSRERAKDRAQWAQE